LCSLIDACLLIKYNYNHNFWYRHISHHLQMGWETLYWFGVALSEHILGSGHRVAWTKAAVIDSHLKKLNCLFLESWHIGMESCSLNREKGSLAQHYRSLLH